MSNRYFDEYLPNLPREQWGQLDELSFYLGVQVNRSTRVVLTDGAKYMSPRRPLETLTNKGLLECQLCGFNSAIQKVLLYYANAPLYADPRDIVFIDKDKDGAECAARKIIKFDPGLIYQFLDPIMGFDASELEIVERVEDTAYLTYLKIRVPSSKNPHIPVKVPVTAIMGIECFGFSTSVIKAIDVVRGCAHV
ncbi:hypothetical protein [Succinatimonas hippei]|uniref:hypothetical protein n=1 Tax=Succinatimonas hippei TaxID=626938 RepID=UPI00255CE791|nr:hypothetical protein [Succinatimonas hippei]